MNRTLIRQKSFMSYLEEDMGTMKKVIGAESADLKWKLERESEGEMEMKCVLHLRTRGYVLDPDVARAGISGDMVVSGPEG